METLDLLPLAGVMLLVYASFTISASVGLGGSLLLVPSLALLLGTKEGVALAALLLAANNVVKVVTYRRTLPFRRAVQLVVLLTIGAFLGASLLVAAPEALIGVAVITSFVATLAAERRGLQRLRRVTAPLLAFGAGATSGVSGTSGPLKGAALRNIDLDRMHFVGAASLASLAGDATKALVFADASLLGGAELRVTALAVPLMLAGTLTGRHLNERVAESGFAIMFWSVMGGYTVRIATTLL